MKSKEKSIEKSNITFKNEKSNNGLKVKIDNGPIGVFICYCCTARWIWYILYHILLICMSGRFVLLLIKTKGLFDTRFGSIQYRSNTLKKKPETCKNC